MKLLKHAQHGWKYATDAEAVADMENGWESAETVGIAEASESLTEAPEGDHTLYVMGTDSLGNTGQTVEQTVTVLP